MKGGTSGLLRCVSEKLRVLANLKGQVDQRRDDCQAAYEVTDVAKSFEHSTTVAG